MQRGCFRWISLVSLVPRWATHRFLPLRAISSWGPGVHALGWVCPLREGLVGGMKVVWYLCFSPTLDWVLCVMLCQRENPQLLWEEVWHKAGKYLSGLQPSCCPWSESWSRILPNFLFSSSCEVFKVESVEPKSNHVQILEDDACSLQPVYIAFHDDLLLSLIVYFVCFLVSGWLIVNWLGEYLLLWDKVAS